MSVCAANSCLLSICLTAVLLSPSWVQSAAPPTTPSPPTTLTLLRTGQISTYDQTGKVIDFQGSGQDGEFQRGTIWPDPRFIFNRNGTISDSLTGLMWFKSGNCFADLPWPSALKAVASFNQGEIKCHEQTSEFHDWFLPDINQLATIIDAQATAPTDALRLAGFTDLQNDVYWTGTSYHGQLNAWGVDFRNGAIDLHSKLDRHLLLLARVETLAGKLPPASSPATTPPPQSGQRFVDNGDRTVTDTSTNLMWLQDGSCLPKLDWQGALAAIKSLNSGQEVAGCLPPTRQYPDWSLPNAIELRSLIDYQMDYPALSSGHHFTSLAPGYWTSTTVAARPEQAFMVGINTGTMLPVPKTDQHHALAVRQVAAPLERPRKESAKSGNLGVAAEYVLSLDPTMPGEISWPPSPRFFSNGDGTSIDAITGITWLTDANCFDKKKWPEAFEVLQKFSVNPKNFKCADYEGGADDWQLPTLAEMRELINPAEKDNAEWLNRQGVKNVQKNSTYWTATETPLNLYFADAISLNTGKTGNYPKSLKFTLWPKRQAPEDAEQGSLLVSMTANAIDTQISLSPQDTLSFAVYLHTFTLRTPADFWFWYDTPDEKTLWLTHIRTWTDKATPVYQGPLFHLKNYEIYRSVTGLAPGVYEFHFAVDTLPNGVFDEPRYEAKTTIIITEGQK